tara:strand:+ start:392 stop:568 length:177 start_codon:yes stop_codon:yes gene_type:complete
MNANTHKRSLPVNDGRAVISSNVKAWRKAKAGAKFKKEYGSLALAKGGASLDALFPNL